MCPSKDFFGRVLMSFLVANKSDVNQSVKYKLGNKRRKYAM